MSILLEQLTKRYEGHPVVNNLSLEVAAGEFFVLIGPSGSGKSTVLRLIAGLAAPDAGRVLLGGRDVTLAPPQQRGLGFVFQHYALFQHMTVADNVEFALRVRGVGAAERRRRRDELLELVGLAGLGGRRPAQLSGGQQQRVALARALAHEPAVLLLDEPFGALDAKIRADLRRALRRVHAELGLTTIFVTHDQEEAFELADRIGVMNFGRLLEVGPPAELYQRPQTEFVATFLGTANLLVGQSEPTGVRLGPLHFPLNTEAIPLATPPSLQRVQVLFRPEDVALAAATDALAGSPLGQGTVEQSVFAGSFERLTLRLPPIPSVRPIAPPVAYGDNSILIEATRLQDQSRRLPLAPGDRVWVGVRRIHALAHPGMSFLLMTDGSPSALAALELGGQIARLAHARVTLLGYGAERAGLARHLQAAREQLGSGLAAVETRAVGGLLPEALRAEVERQPVDLVILGRPAVGGLTQAEQALQVGEHHVLLVPEPAGDQRLATPSHALVCVTGSEPAKSDVLFTGRLVRHLGAQATLFCVLPPPPVDPEESERLERFLVGGVRTLEVLGVPARTRLSAGAVREA
ncbi:MAG: ATP-binding cassette domain-containing protein, partial [Anaerolineales bacterium]|nr:ATP-binding cassette domain-containing protein [Anaerolineales bacterium]